MRGGWRPGAGVSFGIIARIVLDGGTNATAVAWTEANGRFAFGYLPAGQYELRATKTGYESIVYRPDSPAAAAGNRSVGRRRCGTDLVFRLQPVTTITGFSP